MSFSNQCEAGSEPSCKSKTAGIVWLSLETVSIVFAIGACVLIAVKKRFVKFLFILCGITCICGVIAWVANNPVCYNTKLENRTLGASPIIVIICGFMYIIAAFCSAIKRKKGEYTLLK